MKRHSWPKALTLVAIAVATSLAACSLILDKSKDQCAADGDCAKFGAGFSCKAGLCGKGLSDADPTDGTTRLPDGALIDGGCLPKFPKTSPDEFLNEKCTDSKCIPFDNCARLGFCDGGPLPTLVDPPDGGV